MKATNKFLNVFFVTTVSGGVYKVRYTKDKATVVEKIFAVEPKKSKAKVGDNLFPEGKFVGITANMGLWKCQPNNGKKFKIEDKWLGSYMNTSSIKGLFLKKEDAVNYCKYQYNNMIVGREKWYQLPNGTKDVLEQIGKDHPAFILSKELLEYIKEDDLPF